jgi:hypothetical protein
MIPLGIVLCLISYFFLQGLVAFSRELAYALLGPGDGATASGSQR